MKARKTAYRKISLKLISGGELRVIVEVWKIPDPESINYPDGIRFSIVAFKEFSPQDAVIMDCHPPKGPHYHLNGQEISFEWKGLEEAEKKFWHIVEKKFGPVKETQK